MQIGYLAPRHLDRRPELVLSAKRTVTGHPGSVRQLLVPARGRGQDDYRTGKRIDRLWRTAAPDDPQDHLEDRPPRPLVRCLSQRSRQVLAPASRPAASAEYCPWRSPRTPIPPSRPPGLRRCCRTTSPHFPQFGIIGLALSATWPLWRRLRTQMGRPTHKRGRPSPAGRHPHDGAGG